MIIKLLTLIKNIGLISNQTMGYFLMRTYLFMISVGVNKNNIRFR